MMLGRVKMSPWAQGLQEEPRVVLSTQSIILTGQAPVLGQGVSPAPC